MATDKDITDRLDEQADSLISDHGKSWLGAAVTMLEAAQLIRQMRSDANSRPYISAVSSDPDA